MDLRAQLGFDTFLYLSGNYGTKQPRSVPLPEAVPLGNHAALLDATCLFIDVRQSSDITNTFRLQTAAKMMKAYFSGVVRIIRHNHGEVRSFNGDGLLALFIGDDRCEDAARAAMQVVCFVREILQPRFKRYFNNSRAELGRDLEFDVGCGVDDGKIFAVKVGIRGTNDVAWVGRPTNTAAKLASDSKSPWNVAITSEVYNKLTPDALYSDATPMWSEQRFRFYGGSLRIVRSTSYHWTVT